MLTNQQRYLTHTSGERRKACSIAVVLDGDGPLFLSLRKRAMSRMRNGVRSRWQKMGFSRQFG